MYEEISKKIGNKKIINGGYRTVLFDLRLFKKNYCCRCGQKLVIKKTKFLVLRNIFTIVEAEHNLEYFYHCPECKYLICYKNQKKIFRIQTDNESVILPNSKQLILKHEVKLLKIGQNLLLYDEDFFDK